MQNLADGGLSVPHAGQIGMSGSLGIVPVGRSDVVRLAPGKTNP
jgi:hypothetical protein